MPQGIPMQFFAQQWWKSCCCDQFHTYSQWFAAKFNFLNFSLATKCSKCLKYAVLSCFKQNYCISGMPQCIHMQFFAQQWWKSCCCDQFHTYSQWFAGKFNFLKFSNSWKMLKMLKIGCFKLFKVKLLYLRYASRYSHAIFWSTMVKVMLLWPVSHIFTVVCSKI